MAWIYNDRGRGVVILDKSELPNLSGGDYFEIADNELPEPAAEIRTNGKKWWYASIEPVLEVYDVETDIMEITIDHEYRLILLELGITEE